MTCKVDLPNTVDPHIITSIQLQRTCRFCSRQFPDQDNSHYFFPLVKYDNGTYRCQVCLTRSDNNRYYTNCHYGNETLISGKPIRLYRDIITTYYTYTVCSFSSATSQDGSIGGGSSSHSWQWYDYELLCVCCVPHLIASPHVELYGPEQLLLASGDTNFSLNHTLNPVKSMNAGLYVCKGEFWIRSANTYVDFQSFMHLSVQRKLLK